MDVLVTGRHCQVSDEVRSQIEERIKGIEKFRDRVNRVEVQLSVGDNKRQPDQNARAEITLHSRGPVVRAEAAAEDKLVAFERALERLKSQLRKAADRRKVRRGLRSPMGLAEAFAQATPPEPEDVPAEPDETRTVAGIEVQGDGPLVVREKEFPATPLTLSQALDEMELVGHDFFLFVDADTSKPSVVYRRKAYDYGVIRLDVTA